jgi:ribosomal-protein-alanine N-acetyltransferase
MSAVLQPVEARLEPLTVERLDAVCAVEQTAYSHPWTRANFIDSMAVGYHCQCLLAPVSRPDLGTPITANACSRRSPCRTWPRR